MSTVLVMEDEANIRRFVAVNPRAREHAILQAANAEAGLLQLRDHAAGSTAFGLQVGGNERMGYAQAQSGWPSAAQRSSHYPDNLAFNRSRWGIDLHQTPPTHIKPIGAADLILAVSRLFG